MRPSRTLSFIQRHYVFTLSNPDRRGGNWAEVTPVKKVVHMVEISPAAIFGSTLIFLFVGVLLLKNISS